jgi:Tol biopolymer transport system component
MAAILVAAGCHDPAPTTVARVRASGGRVAWYKGSAAAHERIAFDAIVDDATQDTEVFVMNPDGSGVTCVTCAAHPTLPAGFVGQPEWHPDGEHLVVQAENANSDHTRYNHVSWGIDQDLWIVAADGSGAAERIVDNAPYPGRAALHPHFDASGTRLLFSQRIPTGVVIDSLVGVTPGGENPWAGWQLDLWDYDAAAGGTAKLTNEVVLYGSAAPKDRGLYESHGFFGDRILYSATAGGAPYVDDCWVADLDGTNAVDLTSSPSTWEEHGSYSPSGGSLVFISSRVDPGWSYPGDDAGTLRTELYLQRGAAIEQITTFNRDGDPGKRYLTSDYDWDRSGRRIAVQVAPVDVATGVPDHPQIWIVTFPEPR